MLRKQELTGMLAEIDARIDYLETQIRKVPSGTLSLEHRRGAQTYVLATVENGKRKRRSLFKNPELVADIIRNGLLRKELDALRLNRKTIEYALRRYIVYNPAQEMLDIQQKWPLPKGLRGGLTYDRASDEWAEAPFEQLDYKPEMKKHRTSRGLLVRSKSELIIAEKLYELGLPFRYEALIKSNGIILAPDFTIRRADGKLFYLEHMGMTNDRRYLERQLNKIRDYAAIGIGPWDNLIITYDDANGNVDVRAIELAITSKLQL